jgi:plasmid stabilization system protein ParE
VDFKIRISNSAIDNLEDILEYSWTNFPSTAERFGNALLNHLDLLKTFPHIGCTVEIRHGVRLLEHTPILIYYRVHERDAVVEVLHFWHRARKHPWL